MSYWRQYDPATHLRLMGEAVSPPGRTLSPEERAAIASEITPVSPKRCRRHGKFGCGRCRKQVVSLRNWFGREFVP